MLTIQQISHVLHEQHKLNQLLINQNWRIEPKKFMRAYYVEASEALDHIGFKWWATQNTNVEQAQLELVDMSLFLFSEVLAVLDSQMTQHEKTCSWLLRAMAAGTELPPATAFDREQQCNAVERTLFAAVNYMQNEESDNVIELLANVVTTYTRACHACGLTGNTLFMLFMAKTSLNIFRNKNGYKATPPTYDKIWDGLEDNKHLMIILKTLNTDAPDFVENLYAALTERYKARVRA